MTDLFNECLIKRRNGPRELLYKGLIGLGGIAVMVLSFRFIGLPFSIVIVLGVAVGLYFAYREFDVEFEYALTNNELDFDKIISRERRKHLLTIDIATVESFVPKNTSDTPSYGVKNTFDFTAHDNRANVWMLVFSDGKNKNAVLFSPTEKMIEGIQSFLPRYARTR